MLNNMYVIILFVCNLIIDLSVFQDGEWERLVSSLKEELKKISTNGSIPSKPEFCDLDNEIGPCDGRWIRYYYNRTTEAFNRYILSSSTL
uniref:Pancreatic trypsin inhibitorlike [Bos taurus] n=1 Tax=Lepeophtheirus salmonis TaxID=72036 RepID=A0A0K2U618_LEPSM